MEVDGSQSDWKISIQKRLDRVNVLEKSIKRTDGTKITIYRAPNDYREVNRKCLEPKIVSLGPYQRSNGKLRKADTQKWRVLHYMLKRNEQEVGPYLEAMMELEPEARSCYEGDISLKKNEFVEMMLLDGCFIIESFHFMNCNLGDMGYPDSHPLCDGTFYMPEIKSDMLLLENQIPIFVLVKLSNLQQKPVIGGGGFFLNSLIEPFKDFILPAVAPNSNECINGNHILDFVILNLLNDPSNSDRDDNKDGKDEILLKILEEEGKGHPDGNEENDIIHFKFPCASKLKETWHKIETWKRHSDTNEKDDVNIFSLPCASQLKETRIKFKLHEKHPFWKVKFSDQTLYLTRLHLDDRSKTLFCNLIAYEQKYFNGDQIMTGYFMFMSQLIESVKDVEYLIQCKIIISMLGSYDDVVHLFDDITKNAGFCLETSYLREIIKGINKHCDTTWYKLRGILINTYFKNPWSTISFVAAFILLVSTVIQTFYTVYSYYYPKKDVS